MTETDPKTETFKEQDLRRVSFAEVEGQSCWCGEPFTADDDGNAICVRCRDANKEKIN